MKNHIKEHYIKIKRLADAFETAQSKGPNFNITNLSINEIQHDKNCVSKHGLNPINTK